MTHKNRFAGGIDEAWLGQIKEEIIDPDLPIVDPHHHLWVAEGSVYLLPEFVTDANSGHNVRATVFAECRAMYRATGPEEWRSLGETEFVTGISAMAASGLFGPTRVCAAMFGYVDLRLGERVKPILEAHITASGGRFRGIRFSTAWDASERIHKTVPEPGLLRDPRVLEGVACLAPLGLSFDAWVYHTQLEDVLELAGAFPETTIILNHIGTPILGGPYASKREEVVAMWKAGMTKLAKHSNVFVKVGAIPIRLPNSSASEKAGPPSSDVVAGAWQPYVETCIELFGAQRCMFESNFPVQKRWSSYQVVWNAFKRLAAGASAEEKTALFSGTALRAYRLPDTLITR